eukprot:3848823-Prymnesium_polylepis.1
MDALLQLLADNERRIRKEAAEALVLLGDDDWLAAFPSADGPPTFGVLAASERPEVMELLIDLLKVCARPAASPTARTRGRTLPLISQPMGIAASTR